MEQLLAIGHGGIGIINDKARVAPAQTTICRLADPMALRQTPKSALASMLTDKLIRCRGPLGAKESQGSDTLLEIAIETVAKPTDDHGSPEHPTIEAHSYRQRCPELRH
jgi:hypothetical protein